MWYRTPFTEQNECSLQRCPGSSRPKFYDIQLFPLLGRVIFLKYSSCSDQFEQIHKKVILDSKWTGAVLIGLKFPCENLMFFVSCFFLLNWRFQESLPDELGSPVQCHPHLPLHAQKLFVFPSEAKVLLNLYSFLFCFPYSSPWSSWMLSWNVTYDFLVHHCLCF